MKFDTQFEETVLAASLKDFTYLRKAAGVLNSHHFNSPQHAWLWKTIHAIYGEHREAATKKLVYKRARRDFSDQDKRAPYRALIKRIFALKPKAANASLDELILFVRHVNAQLALEEAAQALEKGEVDRAYDITARLQQRDVKPREYTIQPWIEGFQKRQDERKYKKEHPEKFKRIPTGFKRLDAITGGLEVAELGLMLATTNKGKSIMLNNLAFNALMRGYKPAYITFEMSASKINMRQDARWLRMMYDKFKFYDFTQAELRQIEKKRKKAMKRWKNKFHVVGMPVRRCSVDTVRRALDDLKHEYNFEPDMLLFDSADHMVPAARMDSFRLEQSAVYWELKGLAETDGYAVWTSTHAPRDFATEIATAEATGESYDKARIADMVVSLNTPSKKTRRTTVKLDIDGEGEDGGEEVPELSEHAKGKYIEMFLAKYRDGDSQIGIPLDAQFARMLVEEMKAGDDG